MTVKAGIISSAGLQFNMRAEVHLKAKELGIEICDKETADKVNRLYYYRRQRDGPRPSTRRGATSRSPVEEHHSGGECNLCHAVNKDD